ncbi:MIP/aquaporin family protein [uncultured Amnibacterium sp.]|uniref:MIP/aquaporin family protein n=1 Tax=uncultured Amnibacterium sp. TaxID=1631851 RepID=UPI0035CB8766
MLSRTTLRAATAELVGTFLLVLVGTAVAVAAGLGRNTAGAAYDSLAIALAFGLTLTAVVAALGHASGAHVNPAVTIGLASIGRFPWRSVPAYVVAQILGAVIASLVLWAAYGPTARSDAKLGVTAPTSGVNDLQAFLMEVVVGFLLVFVVVAVATDDRVPTAAAPVAIGAALACGVLVAGPISGGAANPARALGPMIVDLSFTSAWAYILGPVLGGVLAAVLYDRFVRSADAEHDTAA